ncbi:MAG: ABC transporter ATP-binding protein/permease [Bacillota bacterium]|nr:ABC transporter ATP-binding protein/permease [Bacillota bacterium]
MINKNLYKFCGNTKKFIFYAVTVDAIKLMASIGFAYIFAFLVSRIFAGDCVACNYKYYIFGAILLGLLKILLIKASTHYNFKVVREVKHNLRESIYKKVLGMGMDYQNVLSTQELNHLSVEGVEQLENYYGSYLSQFYYALVSSVILFFSLLPFSFKIALILMLASLFIPAMLQGIMRIVRNVQKKYWKKYASVGDIFLDSISGITTLKIFEADEKRAEQMDESAEEFRKQTMRVLAMQLNSIMIIDWVVYVSSAVIIVMASKLFIANQLNLFGFLAILTLSAEFFVPMKMLTSKFHVAMTGVAAGESILEFLEVEDDEPSGNEQYPANADIQLQNFHFQYGDGTAVLHGVDMRFQNGKFTALVGASGSGKSTIASIISAQIRSKDKVLYGTLTKDQLLHGEITKHVIRIPHNAHIFFASVRDNILMGKSGVSDENIIQILKKLKMWDFLQAKEGLDTMLLSGGKNISGGQAQRIAIARALVQDFNVYIFDESTSNVDVESEEIILEIIKEIAQSKTVIYISHKMSVVSTADLVYVLKDGKITESGTHAELMQNKGLYYDLYTEQEELVDLNKNKESIS